MGLVTTPRSSLEAALRAIELRSKDKVPFSTAVAIAAQGYGKTRKEISCLVRKGKAYLTGLLSGQEPTGKTAERPATTPSFESKRDRFARIRRIQTERFAIPDEAADIGIDPTKVR